MVSKLQSQKEWFLNLLIESDCVVVVQAVNSSTTDWSELGFLVEDFCDLFAQVSTAKLIHVCRSANEAAHFVARDALHLNF